MSHLLDSAGTRRSKLNDAKACVWKSGEHRIEPAEQSVTMPDLGDGCPVGQGHLSKSKPGPVVVSAKGHKRRRNDLKHGSARRKGERHGRK